MEIKTLEGKSRDNPKGILALANQFHKAYESCIKYKSIGNGKVDNEFIPAYVNLAFACELYLKALLKLKGKKSKGHSLIDLFNELDELDSSIIDDIIKLSNVMTNLNYTKDGYKSLINSVSNTFKSWRYSYEWSKGIIGINAYFFEVFSTALHLISENVINDKELNPDNYRNNFKLACR